MTEKTFIKVRTQFEFCHRWKDAPEEVAFLRNVHRHDFHVTCSIEVMHDDRELEFFMVLHRLEDFINREIKTMPDTTSCEQFCKKIGSYLIDTYGQRNMQIEVSEDNKSSSVVEYNF